MKKSAICLCAFLVLSLCLTGCNNSVGVSSTSTSNEEITTTTPTETKDIEVVSSTTISTGNSTKEVTTQSSQKTATTTKTTTATQVQNATLDSNNLKIIIKPLLDCYFSCYNEGFYLNLANSYTELGLPSEVSNGGWFEYREVITPGIKTVNDVKNHLKKYLSNKLVDEIVTKNVLEDFFVEKNSKLYLGVGAVGSDSYDLNSVKIVKMQGDKYMVSYNELASDDDFIGFGVLSIQYIDGTFKIMDFLSEFDIINNKAFSNSDSRDLCHSKVGYWASNGVSFANSFEYIFYENGIYYSKGRSSTHEYGDIGTYELNINTKTLTMAGEIFDFNEANKSFISRSRETVVGRDSLDENGNHVIPHEKYTITWVKES